MDLVIAEKPSVAISIAKVIGATKKKDGYYEGSGYRVSWCVGHLIQMANPDSYDEKYAKWNMEDLPIVPSEYKYEVSKSTKKQFSVLKKLLNDKEIENVINACDAGREGESIFRLVYNQANCKKKMNWNKFAPKTIQYLVQKTGRESNIFRPIILKNRRKK